MKRIIIYALDVMKGDAVGNHCLGLASLLRKNQFEVVVIAKNTNLSKNEVALYNENIFDFINENDILYTSFSIYEPQLEFLLRKKCKKICYFHGITPSELLKNFDEKTSDLCQRAEKQLLYLNDFDLLICNSKKSALQVSSNTNVMIIPPVFKDQGIFKAKNKENVPGVNSSRKRIINVGRVVPHKKIEDAIYILNNLRNECHLDCHLSIIGDVSNSLYFSHLIEIARLSDMLKYITFHGTVFEFELIEFYKNSDLLLSTSLHEGFGVPVLESMYFGRPAFIRSGTAMDELIYKPGSMADTEEALIDDINNFFYSGTSNDERSFLKESADSILKKASEKLWISLINNI